MEELQKLLAELRKVLVQYEEAEREARVRLEQAVQGRLVQIGAVQGVELAMKVMRPDGAGGEAGE